MIRPRFTLKAILGCTEAISLCLGVAMASEASQVVRGIAMTLLPPVVCGCIGYLANGRIGTYWGLFVGALVLLVLGTAILVLLQ